MCCERGASGPFCVSAAGTLDAVDISEVLVDEIEDKLGEIGARWGRRIDRCEVRAHRRGLAKVGDAAH